MKRTINHWTLHYIYSRILQKINHLLCPETPWLTRQAVQLLDGLLRPEDAGFEWGSGRSTVWLACRTRHLTSVENNIVWYNQVKNMLAQKKVTNISYEFHKTEHLTEDMAESSSYVQEISKLNDQSLDYVLVDGWARDSCGIACITKLKPGGILVLDNANWYLPPPIVKAPASRTMQDGPLNERWARFMNDTYSWRKIWTSDFVTDTLIMFKP